MGCNYILYWSQHKKIIFSYKIYLIYPVIGFFILHNMSYRFMLKRRSISGFYFILFTTCLHNKVTEWVNSVMISHHIGLVTVGVKNNILIYSYTGKSKENFRLCPIIHYREDRGYNVTAELTNSMFHLKPIQ